MLKICDRLGMLLLDECFDVWRLGKVPMDYHLYFEDWWNGYGMDGKKGQNHPCVISYSIGNEIGERDGRNDGAAWSARLSEKIRSLDPTRFVLSAICGILVRIRKWAQTLKRISWKTRKTAGRKDQRLCGAA